MRARHEPPAADSIEYQSVQRIYSLKQAMQTERNENNATPN